MNPYAQLGPLLSYSFKTNKQGQGAVNVSPVPPPDPPVPNPGPFKNLVLCISRRSGTLFVSTVRKVVNDKSELFVAVLDCITHQSTMVAEFNRFVFEKFVAQGEPANTAIVVEDPALLKEAVRSGLIQAYVRSSIVGTNLSIMQVRPPILHVFVSNLAGLASVNSCISDCQTLKASLVDTLPCPRLEIVVNSLLPEPECGGFSPTLQEHKYLYFDSDKMKNNPFTIDEAAIVEALNGKLAFVEDMKTMLTAHKLSNVLGDLGTLEANYSNLQTKVLNGDLISDPDSLRDIVVLEQRIRSLLDYLGDNRCCNQTCIESTS